MTIAAFIENATIVWILGQNSSLPNSSSKISPTTYIVWRTYYSQFFFSKNSLNTKFSHFNISRKLNLMLIKLTHYISTLAIRVLQFLSYLFSFHFSNSAFPNLNFIKKKKKKISLLEIVNPWPDLRGLQLVPHHHHRWCFCLRWACVCVVVIALVWIFGFQMNGGWMGVYTLQTWVDVKMGFDMSLCFIV